jgi:hypothetical protein
MNGPLIAVVSIKPASRPTKITPAQTRTAWGRARTNLNPAKAAAKGANAMEILVSTEFRLL